MLTRALDWLTTAVPVPRFVLVVVAAYLLADAATDVAHLITH